MNSSPSAQQPRAASRAYSPTPEENDLLETNGGTGSLRRKGSFSFLRRSKSRERSTSVEATPRRRLSKKDRSRQRQAEMMQEQIPPRPPRLPVVPHAPDLQTFGGENAKPDTAAIMSNRSVGSFRDRLAQKTSQEVIGSDMYRGMPIPPVPPIPSIPGVTLAGKVSSKEAVSRTESMTHRGRYSYASSAVSTINTGRKIRRRKDPTPFNILVIGARNAGKTSFLNFLQTSLALPAWKQRHQSHSRDDDMDVPPSEAPGAFPAFTSHYVETEVEGDRIGVTMWDSEGLEANLVDLQLKDIITFIEAKFEDTFNEESKVARTPGFRDTHIHCVILVLDPLRLDANIAAAQKATEVNGVKVQANSFAKGGTEVSASGLEENLDLNILRSLKGKTTVVPIVAKADTITSAHMLHLKRAVWESLKHNGLDTLDALSQEEDDNSDTSSVLEINGVNGNTEDAAANNQDDKYSVTSVLDSPSDSSSAFSASDFDLAKPGKPSKYSSAHAASSPSAPKPVPVQIPPLPLSIISPDPYEPGIVGRKFPWGFADPLNSEHCDFTKLKDSVFKEWRADLREASREHCYERWRTSRLNKRARRDEGVIGDTRTQVWAQ